MKKSLRIISLVLTVVMILGSVSVAASAAPNSWDSKGYKTYRIQNGAGLTFDDANQPNYTTDQYASMALDEVDRMLAEEQLVVDIYIGTLNLSSVDGTVQSVNSLLDSVGNLLDLGLLGVASELKKATPAIANTKRANGDITVIWDLLDLIGGLFPIVTAYVNQQADLGILNGFVADYMFNVRELVFGLLYGLTGMGDVTNPDGTVTKYDYMETRSIPSKYQGTGTAKIFMQDVLNTLVLGKWQKLDNIFYESGHKESNIAYSEIVFRDGSANGAIVTGALDTAHYDYYGYVHENRWVTNGLGDFIRVAEGAQEPAASYTKVNFQSMASVYEFVEPIILHAYNNIAVPVLNRITKNWLREKVGYTFDEKYTELYTKDLEQYKGLTSEQIEANPLLWDAENEKYVINPDYDYLYGGEAPEVLGGDSIFKIFDVENLQIPTIASVPAGSTFIEELNNNLVDILKTIVNGTYTLNGNTYTFTLTDSSVPYSFEWTTGSNDNISKNICNVVRFVLQVTGEDFFDKILVNKGAVYDAATLGSMTDQQIVAYIVRSIINTNVNGIWIENDKQTIIDVCLDALIQLAYLDLPQLTYSVPTTTSAKIDKCLTILMDIAAYNLNAEMDTNLNSTAATGSSYLTNNGLLPYQGDNGDYKVSVAILAAWAVYKWACASEYGGGNSLLNLSFGLDNYNGTTGNGAVTADTFWADLDSILNAIVPIKAGNPAHGGVRNDQPWVNSDICGTSSSKLVIKDFLFDSVINPVLELNFAPILKLLTKNPQGALADITLENALVDTIHRVFDLIFPDIFPDNVNEIDSVLVNSTLATVVSDLLVTLSTYKTDDATFVSRFLGAGETYPSTNGRVITGRGKIIAEIALPIVCMVLGLSDSQEFGELENYIPKTISSSVATTQFQIFNGSSGVNTAYKNKNAGYQTTVDQLYTYEIVGVSMSQIKDGVSTPNYGNISGVGVGDTIPAGSSATASITNYAKGDLLEIVYKYKVKDETGNYLSSKNEQGNDVETILTSTSYAYVGETDKGDDEILQTTTINGYKVQAPTDYYITGGLSGFGGFAFRVNDKGGNSGAANVKVTNVSGPSWVSLIDETDVPANKRVSESTLTGESDKSVAVLTPFVIDDNANRVAYETAKDNDGNDIIVDGIAQRGARKTLEAGEYYVEDGDYTVTTTISINGQSANIQTRVHIYSDFGLPGLVNSAIAANRSAETVSGGFQGYYDALCAAAEFVLQPKSQGGINGGYVGSYIAQSNYINKFEKLYKDLYRNTEIVKGNEKSAGAGALWTAVEQVWPHDYQRKSFTYNNTTLYYKDYIEYNEAGYPYIGLRDNMGVPYRQFRSAVNNANGLIDREYKYIGYTPEEFDELTAAEKDKVVAAYLDAVENKQAISSVDSIMAIHRLTLTNDRLISLGAGNRTKLQNVLNRSTFNIASSSGYIAETWEDYANAKTFAQATAAKSDATNEACATAIEKYLRAWKHLEQSADYRELEEAYNGAASFLNSFGYGWDYDNSKVVEDTAAAAADQDFYDEGETHYTAETLVPYLDAVKAGEKILDDKNNGKVLGVSDQDIIDNAVDAISTTYAALVEWADVPGPGPGGDEPDWELVEYDTSDPYSLFATYSGGLGMTFYIPFIDEENTWITPMVEDEESEFYGCDVTGILYGVPEYFVDSDIQALFDAESCEVIVTETENGFGTGSYAFIVDNDGNLLAAYAIVFRGDMNGDGTITGEDVGSLEMFLAFDSEYDWWSFDTFYNAAGDVNGDGSTEALDVSGIDMYLAYMMDIDQQFGGLYDEETVKTEYYK